MNESNAVQLGVVGGIISIIAQILTFQFFVESYGEPMGMANLISYAATIIIIILQTQAVRDVKQSNDGYISFKEALKESFSVTVIASVISFAFTLLSVYVLFKKSYHRMIELTIAKQTEIFERMDMSEEKINEAIERTEQFSSLSLWIQLPSALILGFIISVIISAIMQRKRLA